MFAWDVAIKICDLACCVMIVPAMPYMIFKILVLEASIADTMEARLPVLPRVCVPVGGRELCFVDLHKIRRAWQPGVRPGFHYHIRWSQLLRLVVVLIINCRDPCTLCWENNAWLSA